MTPGYFAAMGIPVRRGREFTESDTVGQPGAAIINESFARRFFAGRDPLGKRLRQTGDNPQIPWLTVVGVVGDVRHSGLSADVEPEMFWPESQATWGATLNRHRRSLTVVVRTIGDPVAMLPAIQAQVAAVDPNRPLIDALPMRDLVARSADVAALQHGAAGALRERRARPRRRRRLRRHVVHRRGEPARDGDPARARSQAASRSSRRCFAPDS